MCEMGYTGAECESKTLLNHSSSASSFTTVMNRYMHEKKLKYYNSGLTSISKVNQMQKHRYIFYPSS